MKRIVAQLRNAFPVSSFRLSSRIDSRRPTSIRIDKLSIAAEGMRFTDFYAAPLCSASRAQIQTGCYSVRVSMGRGHPRARPRVVARHRSQRSEVRGQR